MKQYKSGNIFREQIRYCSALLLAAVLTLPCAVSAVLAEDAAAEGENNTVFNVAETSEAEEQSTAGWKKGSGGRWWYDNGDGTYPYGEFKDIDGETYYFGTDGYMVTGWQSIKGNWYFFENSGAMKRSAWEGDYYLQESGVMARSRWVENHKYYVDASGKWAARWEKNSKGWWYNYGDGSYPKNTFETIGGQRYYFDKNGYMMTGWQEIGGRWYYFGTSGAAASGWNKIKNVWYYFDNNNAMVTGWQTIGGERYYFDNNGGMATGWQEIGSDWYFFRDSGAMVINGWEDVYYLDASGKMVRNKWVNGHYFGKDGALVEPYGKPHWAESKTGWRYDTTGYGDYVTDDWMEINGKKYRFGPNGYLITGWYHEGFNWYYLTEYGAYRNQWLKDKGKWYYFKDTCEMVYDDYKINGKTYHFTRLGVWVSDTIDAYLQEAYRISMDQSHGYSMTNRWGPDYDCSSFVITVLRNCGFNTGAATYTGNMLDLTNHGWVWYTDVSQRQTGDILLIISGEDAHTGFYVGYYKGGYDAYIDAEPYSQYPQTGDQAYEIAMRNNCTYFSWDGFLRYEGN